MIEMFFDLLYMLPLSLVSIYFGNFYIATSEVTGIMIAVDILVSVFWVFMFNIKNRLKYIVPVFFVMLGTIIVLFQPGESRIAFCLSLLWIPGIILLSLLCELLGKLTEKYIWVSRIESLVILAYLIYLAVNQQDISRAVIILLLFMLLIFTADNIQRLWIKSADTDRNQHLVFISPFIMLTCFLVFKIPASSEPYDWELFVNVWNKAVEVANDIADYFPGRDTGSLAEIGFSNNAAMEGIGKDSSKVIMEVNTANSTGKKIYLAARSFDSFDGREWTAEAEEIGSMRLFDLVQTQCAVRKKDSEHYSDYIKSGYVEIKYLMYKPGFLFAPLKTVLLNNSFDDVSCIEQQNMIREARNTGRNIAYTVRFDNLNYDKEKFSGVTENCEPITKEEWNAGIKAVTRLNIDGISYEDYLAYEKGIYDAYYSEVKLSDAVKTALDEVTANSKNDWERLKKLEAWLGSFDYNLYTDSLPDTVNSPSDFLDYFLCERKEGYCVHFATAMALIARAEGYPSRITQGVYLPAGNRNVQVTTGMAHVWTEVYIDNFGWVRFEPTPGYKADNSWTVSEEYVAKEPIKRNEDYVPGETETVYEEVTEEENVNKFPVKLIITLVGFVFLFTIIIISGVYIWGRRKLGSLDFYKKTRLLCRRNLQLLDYSGYKVNASETLSEFKERISKDNKLAGMLDFIDVYEELLYSCREAGLDDLAIIDNNYESIKRLLLNKNAIARMLINISLFIKLATWGNG